MAVMSENEIKRLRWRCRRGMRELDLLLESWLTRHETANGDAELRAFARFLDSTDMELYDWITGRAAPADKDFETIVNELMSLRVRP